MTTTILITQQAPLRLSAFAAVLKARLLAVFKAIRHRGDLALLARFDDRMLADIGLTRGDLRDAVAEPPWRDPTQVLVARAHERRALRGRAGVPYRLDAPSIAPSGSRAAPRGRYY